jgi:hypothetical protein
VITDDEVLRVLERANPASVDDPIPMLDVAVYRDALHTRSATVTVIDSEPETAVATRGRWWPILVAAVAVAVVAVLAFVRGNEPEVVPTATTTPPTPSTDLVSRPLDPPIECQSDQCPSLAVSRAGTLVAYDHATKTLTWYDAEPHGRPVTASVDELRLAPARGTPVEQARLVAWGPNDIGYLLVGSPDADAWELVAIDQAGEQLRRVTAASPNVERSDFGVVERLCWSGCDPDVRILMGWMYGDSVPAGTHPAMSRTASGVAVQRRELRWDLAWRHTPSSRSQVAPRWDGGAVLTLVPESGDGPTELFELLPDGSVQRFELGDAAVHVLLPDGSAVIWRDGQLVRLSPPEPAEPPGPWSRELTAHPLSHPIHCGPDYGCGQLAVSPEGTLVAYDSAAATLSWHEDELRVVPIAAELGDSTEANLIAIGPHDIAYFRTGALVVAVAPSGVEITRQESPVFGVVDVTAAGIVTSVCTGGAWNRCSVGSEWPAPNASLRMPWVDLDGNPITDPQPYPTARDTGSGVEVRLGQRTWLVPHVQLSGRQYPSIVPRSDGGAVMLLDETVDAPGQPITLYELLADGTVERYTIGSYVGPTAWPVALLPDGSVIVQHDRQLIRITTPRSRTRRPAEARLAKRRTPWLCTRKNERGAGIRSPVRSVGG